MLGFLLGEFLIMLDFSCTKLMSNSIVDLHSHLGDDASPSLSGAADTNSRKGLVQPVSFVTFMTSRMFIRMTIRSGFAP